MKRVFSYLIFFKVLRTPIHCAQRQCVAKFLASLYRHCCCLCVKQHTHTHSPLWVSETLLPKIAQLLLFGLGTRHTCQSLSSSLRFLIINVAITAWCGFNLTFRSRKVGTFAWLIRILWIRLFSYFLSGSLMCLLSRPCIVSNKPSTWTLTCDSAFQLGHSFVGVISGRVRLCHLWPLH